MDSNPEDLVVEIHTKGDPSVGIFSHTESINLGVVANDIDDELRDHIREKMKEALEPLYHEPVQVTYRDEQPEMPPGGEPT